MNAGPFLRSATPDRPGPGPLPAEALRALQIEIGRRLQGMLAGDYRSSQYGEGVELAQVRPYVPGDDVRKIEWNVTARMGEPLDRVARAGPRVRDGTGTRRAVRAVGRVGHRGGLAVLGLAGVDDRADQVLRGLIKGRQPLAEFQ